MHSSGRYLQISIYVLILAFACAFQLQLGHVKTRCKRNRSILKKLRVEELLNRNNSLVGSLARVPYAEDSGIVLSVKKIPIPGAVPYNPTLFVTDCGYDLFFRYDVISKKSYPAPFFTYVGVTKLDKNFTQKHQSFQTLDLGSDFAEDPCLTVMNDQVYLFYNQPDPGGGRFMSLASLDPHTYKVNYTTSMEMNLAHIEKNWSPFIFSDEQKSHLFIEYQIHPRKLLELPDVKVNDLRNLVLPRSEAYLDLEWEHKWGRIRGGAPAQKVGDEYLGFFHSSQVGKDGIVQFLMGAYTFESKPPFRLTAISKYPILFQGIYDSPIVHTAPLDKRVIYPRGFVVDGDCLHLACGENDCAIKIVTMDIEKLKSSLLRLKD